MISLAVDGGRYFADGGYMTLVEKLRSNKHDCGWPERREAAARIEKLEKALRLLRAIMLDDGLDPAEAKEIIDGALTPAS